jgi:subtilase family serine protease
MNPFRLAVGAFAGAVLILSTGAAAGANTFPVRHAPVVIGHALTAESLHGSFAGTLPAQTPIRVHVLLQTRHTADIERFADLQNTPGSPEFGRYLTPQEFGRYFGADPATIARALAMLRANGFTIDDVANNRRDIVAHAPASAVSAFFSTPLDRRVDRGRYFYAARYVPSIPPALGAELVTGLNDYHVLHSHMRKRPNQKIDGSFSWAPADVAVAYDLNPLYAAGLNGAGITMANATAGAASATDLAHFQATFKLPAAKLVSTPIGGALSPSCGQGCDNGESTLDVDWATATARNVTFNQVVGHTASNNDFDAVYAYIADKIGATTHVVTTSWGACEHDQDPSEQSLDNSYFEQAAVEGQWWFSASGDNGTDDCEDNVTKSVSVDFPGSSPWVISVGGSDVHATITSAGTVTAYKSETVWAYGTCAYNGTGSNGAGGGGKSLSYTKPTYQNGVTPADGRRDTPDVSLLADDVNDGLFIYQGGIQGGNGGTSEAAPQWAGLMAIIEQKKGNYKSVLNPHTRLYQFAASPSRASWLHDVIGGNNGVPACAGDIAVFPGYAAVEKYDLASGIGSYIAANLVKDY